MTKDTLYYVNNTILNSNNNSIKMKTCVLKTSWLFLQGFRGFFPVISSNESKSNIQIVQHLIVLWRAIVHKVNTIEADNLISTQFSLACLFGIKVVILSLMDKQKFCHFFLLRKLQMFSKHRSFTIELILTWEISNVEKWNIHLKID